MSFEQEPSPYRGNLVLLIADYSLCEGVLQLILLSVKVHTTCTPKCKETELGLTVGLEMAYYSNQGKDKIPPRLEKKMEAIG